MWNDDRVIQRMSDEMEFAVRTAFLTSTSLMNCGFLLYKELQRYLDQVWFLEGFLR